jgi:hypothetical protein
MFDTARHLSNIAPASSVREPSRVFRRRFKYMRHRRAGWLLLLLLFIVSAARPAHAQRRYAIDAIVIDAAVQPTGSLTVREQLTYNFRGRYTFAFRDFPPIPDGQIAGLAVSEAGRAYQQSDSNEPGTFTVTRESSSTRVTWYFRADDERRTFDLSFSIDGAVRRYPDTAEF